jgi:hypothetical protein
LDIYPGVDVGVLGKDFGIGAHIGARYFFTNRIGVFAEVGNNGSLGVSLIYNQIIILYDKASRFGELFYLA